MSNTIYSAILPVISQDKNKFNFVYQITEISTGMKYIGSRGSEKLPAIEDLKKYKSSTLDTCFEIKLKYNPLNYHYEILSYHSTRDEATLEESRLHFLYDVKCNPGYYNRSNQTPNGFSTAGRVTVRDKYGNTSSVPVDDPRYLSGELVGHSKGKVVVKDEEGNMFQVDKNDPRYLSGELPYFKVGNSLSDETKEKISNSLIGNSLSDETKEKLSLLNRGSKNKMFGKVVIKKDDGSTIIVDKNDELILNHTYKPGMIGENNGMYGKKHTAEAKQKMSKSRQGSKNPAAKSIVINNIKYNTVKEASIKLNIHRLVVSNRCRSTDMKWKDWYFL